MIDPYSLFKFLILVCLLFIAYLHSISHNLSLLSRRLNLYRRLLNYVLQALVNKSINMVKQLYYSEIQKTSKSICLNYIQASILK